MTLREVKPVQIGTLVDFNSGPFSDNKKFSNAQRRVILTKVLRELLQFPRANAFNIVVVNEKLKTL